MSQFFVKLSAVTRSSLLKLAYQYSYVRTSVPAPFFFGACSSVLSVRFHRNACTSCSFASPPPVTINTYFTINTTTVSVLSTTEYYSAVLVVLDDCPVCLISQAGRQAGRQCGSVKLQMRVSYSKHQTLIYTCPPPTTHHSYIVPLEPNN